MIILLEKTSGGDIYIALNSLQDAGQETMYQGSRSAK